MGGYAYDMKVNWIYGQDYDPDKMKYIGKPMPMVDGPERVSANCQWTENVKLPGQLVGKFLRSPHPHARIRSIDISKAQALPGVKAILTPFNIDTVYPYRKQFTVARHLDRYVVGDKVRFIGDEVCAVAAVDDDTAEEALKLINVEYEILPHYIEPEDALAPGAALIHEKQKTNEVGQIVAKGARGTTKRGDIEKGFKEADFIFESVHRSSNHQHDLIEPRVCTAEWVGDTVNVYSTLQAAYRLRTELSSDLQLNYPQNKIRIISPFTGAGLGNSKSGNYVGAAILLARMAGRPVQVKLDRFAELTATYSRSSSIWKYRTGHKADGTLTAWSGTMMMQNGAYCDLGTGSRFNADVFDVPNLNVEGVAVYTNTIPSGNYRGVTGPQATWAMNVHMFQAACAMGIDPLGFFLKNVDRKPTRAKYANWNPDDTINGCVAKHGWQWHKPGEKTLPDGRKHGIGIGLASWGGTGGRSSGAIVSISDDGTVVLITGLTDLGNGAKTTAAQVCADVLGCKYTDVLVKLGDTQVCPWDGGASGSRTLVDSALGVTQAALDAKRKLLYEASLQMKVTPDALDAEEGMVYVKADPAKKLSFGHILSNIQGYDYNISPIVGSGDRPLKPAGLTGAMFCSITEVAVDTQTGEVEVLKKTDVYDIGKAINPNIVRGQMFGGATDGLGFAFKQDLIYDKPTGLPLTTTHETMPILGPMDFIETDCSFIEKRPPVGLPFGALGFGEGSTQVHMGCLGNAIFNAIGVPSGLNIPYTPDNILKALGKG